MNDPVIEDAVRRLSNWGRWGPEDEIGTVNLITPKRRQEAAELVRTGEMHSLAIPYDREGPWNSQKADKRLNPQHLMIQTGTDVQAGVQRVGDVEYIDGWGYADDLVCLCTHGATHWDSLAHAFLDYRMYNDRPCTLVDVDGAQRNSIAPLADKIATRAILLDFPRALGVDALDGGHPITVAEIELTLEAEKVEVRSGDILLFRTGYMSRVRREVGWEGYVYGDEPGPGMEALTWFHQEDIAGVATDTWAFEVTPAEVDSIFLPLHAVGLTHMGLLVGENFAFDAVAEACERNSKWEFMFVAPALPLSKATASPLSPVAIF